VDGATHESIVAILDAKNEKLQERVWELEADNAKRGATIYEQQIIIASLEEEIARLLDWIRGGDHRRSCPQSKMLLLESDPEPEPCTCGLDEILNPKGGE
jgi:hypothetical protein